MSDGVDGVGGGGGAAAAQAAAQRQAQEAAQSQQVGAQQAQQQQAQQAQQARGANPTTSGEVAANGQANRLERGAQSLSGGDRTSGGAGREPGMPERVSARSEAQQASMRDVHKALERAETQRPSGQPQPGDAHLKNGDHQPAKGSEEARQRAERANHDAKNPDSPKSAQRFDRAAEEARARAGLDHGKTQPVRVDPQTGTETEHKGKGSNGRPAGTSYDGAHKTPGQAHERPHVGFQNGKGTDVKSGNIPYDGAQQASRGQPSDPNTKVEVQAQKHQERLEQLRQRVEEAQRTPPNQRTPEMRQAMAQAARSNAFRLMMRFPWARRE